MKKIFRTRQASTQWQDDASIDTVVQRIYAHRGISTLEQVAYPLKNMHSPQLLKGIDQACVRLLKAKENGDKIVIVGDYDADGATSTAVMVSGLQLLGFFQVDYQIPNRFSDGYGLSLQIVNQVYEKFSPQVLITVDTGIVNHAGVCLANEKNIDVIITDHHLPGAQLPPACAIVNPNQPDDSYPSKCLAGVGVAFNLLVALRRMLLAENMLDAENPPNLAQLLDLVAFGTVADLVPLDYNNRLLVHQGILRIRAGLSRPGVDALISVSRVDAARLSATDISFRLAPRLNAAGRLDDMSVGVACLLAADASEARALAKQLDTLNGSRQEIELKMVNQATKMMQDIAIAPEKNQGVCVYQPDWHEGVIGILASRLKERYTQPSVVFANAEEDGCIKGSARSIPGIHLRDLLADISAEHPDLLVKFGGHAMAAGMTIRREDFDLFNRQFCARVAKCLADFPEQNVLLTDGGLTVQTLNMSLARWIATQGVWGQAYPEPLFHDQFVIESQQVVASRHLKLRLRYPDTQATYEAIWFAADLDRWPNHRVSCVDVAYRLQLSSYLGEEKLSLVVVALQTVAVEAVLSVT